MCHADATFATDNDLTLTPPDTPLSTNCFRTNEAVQRPLQRPCTPTDAIAGAA